MSDNSAAQLLSNAVFLEYEEHGVPVRGARVGGQRPQLHDGPGARQELTPRITCSTSARRKDNTSISLFHKQLSRQIQETVINRVLDIPLLENR